VIPQPPRGGGEAPSPEPPLALSVDVEDYYQVQAFAHIVSRESWGTYPSRVARNTRRLLDLFQETNAQATFFVLGWVARAEPGLVREIASRGHEVASHGMDHRMLTELTPSEFRTQARDSRALLEDLAQAPVIGFRAPSYSVREQTLWAIGILAETGYSYDSSVYPIARRRYGWPRGPWRPGTIHAPGVDGNGAATLTEFPLPTIPLGPIRFPVLAGAYLRLLPRWVSLMALEFHIARRLPIILNVHPWEIDPDQPRVSPTGGPWTHYVGLAKTEGILRAALRRGRFRDAATRLRELGLLGAERTP
jgi:polysaccharide deacetylase family protein (PEP-CTERM system associated)